MLLHQISTRVFDWDHFDSKFLGAGCLAVVAFMTRVGSLVPFLLCCASKLCTPPYKYTLLHPPVPRVRSHPGEKAKRRDPLTFTYSGTACPEFRRVSRVVGCGCVSMCMYVCVCMFACVFLCMRLWKFCDPEELP